jgi:hypothetical protein
LLRSEIRSKLSSGWHRKVVSREHKTLNSGYY